MNRSVRGLFVTGTDTGVGKTLVACAIVSALRGRSIDVGVMKPVETGVGKAGPLDALALQRAAETQDPIELICPQQFALAAAPPAAARAAEQSVDLYAIRNAFAEICKRRELVVVEGAGGLLVPITDEVDMAGLAGEFDLPLLVVTRASLGTINHTLLTLEVAQKRGLEVAGVVISHAAEPASYADIVNLEELRLTLGDLLRGEIPTLREGEQPGATVLDIDGLLGSTGGLAG